jgi:hypothetical protein
MNDSNSCNRIENVLRLTFTWFSFLAFAVTTHIKLLPFGL